MLSGAFQSCHESDNYSKWSAIVILTINVTKSDWSQIDHINRILLYFQAMIEACLKILNVF